MKWAAIGNKVVKVAAAGLWLAFPLAPMLSENFYYSVCTLGLLVDPYEWEAIQWVLVLGPLCGYGFLSGVTWGIGDEPGGRWWWRWMFRRFIWVGFGPWFGIWSLMAVGFTIGMIRSILPTRANESLDRLDPSRWVDPNIVRGMGWIAVAWWCSGWVVVAWLALRRARRADRLGRSWRVGMGVMTRFVGSLFFGYWIVTTIWRDYFFDATIVP